MFVNWNALGLNQESDFPQLATPGTFAKNRCSTYVGMVSSQGDFMSFQGADVMKENLTVWI